LILEFFTSRKLQSYWNIYLVNISNLFNFIFPYLQLFNFFAMHYYCLNVFNLKQQITIKMIFQSNILYFYSYFNTKIQRNTIIDFANYKRYRVEAIVSISPAANILRMVKMQFTFDQVSLRVVSSILKN
jgi:hypothetical protein